MSSAFDRLTEKLLAAEEQDLIALSGELGEVIPELKVQFRFDQCSPHHAYDLFTHTVLVTAGVPATPALRWAALLHDIGKPAAFTRDETGRGHFRGHALLGARMAEIILTRLEAPRQLREYIPWLIENHMTHLEKDPQTLTAFMPMGKDALLELVALQRADMGAKGTPRDEAQFVRLQRRIRELFPEE